MKTIKLTLLTLILISISLKAAMPKEYYKINDIEKSKKYFFEHFYTMIENENLNTLNDRKFITSYLNSNILTINFNSPAFKKLLDIKKRYRVKKLFSKDEYLQKVDVIPPAMALAQAAIESGWGRSRFIKEANNIFGHWTYNPKIGMLPEHRDEGATHYIRIFKTLEDSIKAYMLNLNRNRAYKEFQVKRFEQRQNKQKPQGLELSQTMLKYSGIGHNYLELLENVITKNNLKEYDEKFYKKIN